MSYSFLAAGWAAGWAAAAGGAAIGAAAGISEAADVADAFPNCTQERQCIHDKYANFALQCCMMEKLIITFTALSRLSFSICSLTLCLQLLYHNQRNIIK